jgi:ferredoxin
MSSSYTVDADAAGPDLPPDVPRDLYGRGRPDRYLRFLSAFDAGPATALHFERFSAAPILDGRPFTLRLRRSGRILPVPADRSVLDVLREWDPATAYSCRQGFCGVCTARVTAGTVDHRDGGRLSEQERADGQMRVCVSRAPEGECLELDR